MDGWMSGKVLPPDDTSLETHLDRLAEKHTWTVFEETLVSGYLTAIVSAQPSPVLLQVFVFSFFDFLKMASDANDW